MPASSPRGGTHTGMSDHGSTFCFSRKSAFTQVKFAFDLSAVLIPFEHFANTELFGRPGRVVNSGLAFLDHANGPFRQIARIDELHRIARIAGREHFATAIDPHRPISKAIRLDLPVRRSSPGRMMSVFSGNHFPLPFPKAPSAGRRARTSTRSKFRAFPSSHRRLRISRAAPFSSMPGLLLSA